MRKIVKHYFGLLLLAAATTMILHSCTGAEYEYSRYPCTFSFNNQGSRSLRLAEAMNSNAPGTFCRIATKGSNYYAMTGNQGGTTESVVRTEPEKLMTVTLGVYNETGIIVGYGNTSLPAVFYVYDSQCPNCYSESNMPRYQLTMTSAGKAVCPTCKREYDLNNEGLQTKGKQGSKTRLFRYRGSTTGPQGVLMVNNR